MLLFSFATSFNIPGRVPDEVLRFDPRSWDAGFFVARFRRREGDEGGAAARTE